LRLIDDDNEYPIATRRNQTNDDSQNSSVQTARSPAPCREPLESFPDRASAGWRDQDSAAADADGWNIFNAGKPDARLERDDDASIFLDDGSVWVTSPQPGPRRCAACNPRSGAPSPLEPE